MAGQVALECNMHNTRHVFLAVYLAEPLGSAYVNHYSQTQVRIFFLY